MTYTTTATYTTSYAPKTPQTAASTSAASQGGSSRADQGVRIRVSSASAPTFTAPSGASTTRSRIVPATTTPSIFQNQNQTQTATVTSSGTTGTSRTNSSFTSFASSTQSSTTATSTTTTAQSSTSTTKSSTTTTSSTTSTTGSTSSTSSSQPKNFVKDAFYAIFYQKIEELIAIVEKYPLNDLQGNRLRLDRVSVQLSEWILSVLDAHAPATVPAPSTAPNPNVTSQAATKLSDEALHKDVLERLQKLARILVEDMHNTPTKKPLLDRKKHVWDRENYDEWIQLSRLAVTKLGINQFRFVDRTVDGVTKKVEVILSPIDNEPMEMRHHSFAKAVVAWYYSLPWDLILSSEELPPNPSSAEAEAKVSAESSLVVSEPNAMTFDQMMRFYAYQGRGPAVRLTLNSLDRAERATKETKKWEEDAEQLRAERAEAEKNTNAKLKNIKTVLRKEMARVNASHDAVEAASRAREVILKERLEEDAKRIAALEVEDRRKQQQINGLSSAVSSANASSQAAWAHANSVQSRVVTVEKVVHKRDSGCSLQ